MNARKKNPESGQALILLVMAVVGLLGFTSLAIDGGMIYSDRRIAQNAADAAALAGASAAGELLKGQSYDSWSCPDGDAEQAAYKNALDNDFVISKVDEPDMASAENAVAATCYPASHYIDVHVKTTIQTQTAFAHFVFKGILKNTVEAVARVYGPLPVAGDKALLALDTDCKMPLDGGIDFAGDLTVTVRGGSVHSNCDLTTRGSKGTVDVLTGTITYNQDYGIYKDNGGMNITPTVQGSYDVIDVTLDPPDCSDPDVKSNDQTGSDISGSATIKQGLYTNISVENSGEKLIMEPGLYCIYGNFKATGGELVGDGVTLYFPETAGTFNTQGNATVTLRAPQPPLCEKDYPTTPGGCKPAIGGLLIYYEPGGKPSSPDIKLGGTSASEYEGMIYAPNTAVNIGGSSDASTITYGISVVAFHITIYGTTNIDIKYDASKMPLYPAWIQVYR